MTHIKKLNEMTSSVRTNKMLNESELIDTIKKYDSDKLNVIEALVHNEYSLTLDGLLALYKHFYNDDISFFTEFLEYTGDKGNDWLADEYEWWDFVKLYVVYKLLNDISIEEIIQAIIDEEYYNYLPSNCDVFDDFDHTKPKDVGKWVDGICAKLGIQAPDMDD